MKTLNSFKKSKKYVVYVEDNTFRMPFQFHFCTGKDLGAVVATVRYGLSCGTSLNDTVKVFDATDEISSRYGVKSKTKVFGFSTKDSINEMLSNLLSGESYDLDECIETYNFKPFFVTIMKKNEDNTFHMIKSKSGFPTGLLESKYEHIFTTIHISVQSICSNFAHMKTWDNTNSFYLYPVSEEAVEYIKSNF